MNNTIMQNDNQEQPVEKKKRIPWIIAGLLLVILLVGAAFVGGSLLNKSARDASADMMMPEFTPADEMPKEEPELIGLVSSLEGDTLTVQEFNMNDTLGIVGEGGVFVSESEIAVSEEDMESENVSIEYTGADGLVTEVVITHDTKIYKDKTQFSGYVQMEEGSEMPEMPDKIEQKIEPGTADEIGTNATVTVWGERRGDRVIATFILFQPAIEYGDGE